MVRFFKKYFIPHKDNENQPHILRKRAILSVLVFILLLEGLFLFQILVIFPLTNFFSAILPNILVELANLNRQENNLPELRTSLLLEQAAQLKANDMAQKGYFAHTSPSGQTPWYWLEQVGYKFQAAGENLAINFVDSKDIDEAWMNSEGHRKNILDNNFTEIGIAAAKGNYNGQETTFVVQFFGLPAQATVKKIVSEAPPVFPGQAETPKTETPKVASASRPEEMFTVAGSNEAASSSQPAGVGALSNTQQEKTKTNSKVLWLNRILSMPRYVLTLSYMFIALIILLGMILKFFIKIKIQYPRLLFRGLIVLFVVISILYFNYLLAAKGMIY